MQTLAIYQSLWAMERRQPDRMEWPLAEKLRRITDGGYDGVSSEWTDRAHARTVAAHAAATGTGIEGVCFPRTVDALKPLLDLASEFPVTHLNVQPNAMPRTVAEAVGILEGWLRLAEEVSFPVLFETHRDRMTTDLHFTLDLLDALPDLPLLADLSHFFVGREFPVPVSDDHHAEIRRILSNAWAFHGRVASREQVQIEVSFPQHRPNLDLFLGWWGTGFDSWRGRAGVDDTLIFTCELGPQPYAISGADGADLSDRWTDALLLRQEVRTVWDRATPNRERSVK